MELLNKHIGFTEENAPETAVWTNTSFVKTVHPADQRKHGRFDLVLAFGILGLFAIAAIVFFAGLSVEKRFPDLNSNVFTAISGVMIFSAIILAPFQTLFSKLFMIAKIRGRGELLFQPDGSCAYVAIEDPLTYDKHKLLPEDFGLLKITPEFIQLEMCNHRAQFAIEDVNMSLLHTGQDLACVRLSSRLSPYPWSIAVTALAMPNKIFNKLKSAARAKLLFNLLQEAGVQAIDNVVDENPAADQSIPLAGAVEEVTDSSEAPQASPSPANADVLDIRYKNIVDAIREKEKKRKSWITNVAILVFSLYLFIQLGFFRMGLQGVLVIIAVLFVHEMGHLLGMKMFGYKNVQMFFIPMMGAAVSGTSQNVASWKKSVVTLMGPLPGIFLSLVFLILYLVMNKELLLLTGVMFLLLNLLNLLPLYPLDGGRFVNEVLFSRNRYLELVTNILAAAVFLLAGFAADDWILKMLGFFNLFSLRYRFKMATAAMQLRKEFFETENRPPGIIVQDEQTDIPEQYLKQLIDWIYQNTPGSLKPKTAAQIATQLWERIRIRPPRLGATMALLGLFVLGYITSFVAIAGYGYCYYKQNYKTEVEIVEVPDESGQFRFVEQVYVGNRLDSETELTDDKQLYHGSYKSYYEDDILFEEGQWQMGKRTGLWKLYDPNEQLFEITVYEEGIPVLLKEIEENGEWTESGPEDWTEEYKTYWQQESEILHGPGDQ